MPRDLAGVDRSVGQETAAMSDRSPPVEVTDQGAVEGEQILEALGYEQGIHRAVSMLGTIAHAISDITPTASLLVNRMRARGRAVVESRSGG
jgi:hypothetical protein